MKDVRLKRRLISLVEQLSQQPTASVPVACGNWSQTKAAYRFWDNDKVDGQEIRKAHQLSTVARMKKEEIILAIQDTTNLDFSHHPQTSGLGYLDASYLRGLKVHSTLAVNTAGVPLGILVQKIWARDLEELGKKKQRKQKKTQEKESQRWLDCEQETVKLLQPGQTLVTVADCEADIFDLFSQIEQGRGEFLIRATHNRRVTSELSYLLPTIETAPVIGETIVHLHRNPRTAARDARLRIQFTPTHLCCPAHRTVGQRSSPVAVNVILATEIDPPSDVEPIRWLLLTTLPVPDLAAAITCLRYYTLRWLIERYHYTLKSGCQIEQLQLNTAERLQRAFGTYSLVAWRLLWLTYLARVEPDRSCDAIFSPDEWQALACHHLGSRTPPRQPPTLGQAVLWIAQLGGFLARRHDGVPGVKIIWRGLSRLADLVKMWRLLRRKPHPT
jgi:IS4 transposase